MILSVLHPEIGSPLQNTLLRRTSRVRLCIIAVTSMLLINSANAGLAKAARAETSPSGVVNQSTGEQWSFFVTNEGEVAYWYHSSTEGWVKHVLGGSVKSGTSLTTVMCNKASVMCNNSGEILLFYVNAKAEIANWTFAGGVWQSVTLGGEVAEKSSPSAALNAANTLMEVAYVNKSGELAQFRWNTKWTGPTSVGGSVKAHTSPAVAMWESGETFIYYVNKSAEIANYTYSEGVWSNRPFGGKVAENSSPSTATNGSTMLVSYISSNKEVAYFLWNGTTWSGPSNIGGVALVNTGTSTIINKLAEILVYYVNSGTEVASWTLSGTKWTGEVRGGKVEKGTSPSATVYLSNDNQYVFFENNSAEISVFADISGEWIGPTVL